MCRKHYIDYVGIAIRKELKVVYRDPESAYSAFDFAGKGLIAIQTLLQSIAIKRLNF